MVRKTIMQLDEATGEIITTTQTTYKKEVTPPFNFIFPFASVEKLSKVSSAKAITLFLLLASHLDYETSIVSLTSADTAQIDEALNIKPQFRSKLLQVLKKSGLIASYKTQNTFLMHPLTVWKGSIAKRKEFIINNREVLSKHFDLPSAVWNTNISSESKMLTN